jgi:predicted nucleic acid-binding protein
LGQVKRLERALRSHKRIAFDTSIFIYQLENYPRYVALTNTIFTWVELPGHSAVTSILTVAELLVPAYRNSDQKLLAQYRAIWNNFPKITWLATDPEVADMAARIRAMYRLKTPDAIQAATAIVGDATLLVTNDPEFKRVREVESIVLEELL